MTLEARTLLRKDVMAAEGLRLKPYTDTVGKLTIGYGRNLDDVGITQLEAEVLLDHDLAQAERECRKAFEWFPLLTDRRQRVITEMVFNLGLSRFRGFGRTIQAIKAGDYERASRQMLSSRWASQVKGRAVRLAEAMKAG